MRRIVPGALLPLLATCGQTSPHQPRVEAKDAWVRLPAVPGRPGAAYFTVSSGRADTRLLRVEVDGARRSELHDSTGGGMRPLGELPLPANATIPFGPGGRHVMLFGLDPRLKAGGSTNVKLVLADGRMPSTPARVVGPADPAP